LALTFRRRSDYDTQLGVFCCEHYKKCEIYRMLMENKYDEEE
jgi:predicted metal-binding transcription factor (methanogenesis marker protein 9)